MTKFFVGVKTLLDELKVMNYSDFLKKIKLEDYATFMDSEYLAMSRYLSGKESKFVNMPTNITKLVYDNLESDNADFVFCKRPNLNCFSSLLLAKEAIGIS